MHFFIVKKSTFKEPVSLTNTTFGSGSIRTYPVLRSKYLPMITRYVMNNNGRKEDAEDLLQDALIVFIRKTRQKDFQLKCSEGTFDFAIAKNLWKKRLCNSKKEDVLFQGLEHKLAEEPEVLYEAGKVNEEVLRQAFRKLSCPCRRILNYFYFHEKKYEDIIRLMNISTVQVAKNQKLRCIQKLRILIRKMSGKNVL